MIAYGPALRLATTNSAMCIRVIGPSPDCGVFGPHLYEVGMCVVVGGRHVAAAVKVHKLSANHGKAVRTALPSSLAITLRVGNLTAAAASSIDCRYPGRLADAGDGLAGWASAKRPITSVHNCRRSRSGRIFGRHAFDQG